MEFLTIFLAESGGIVGWILGVPWESVSVSAMLAIGVYYFYKERNKERADKEKLGQDFFNLIEKYEKEKDALQEGRIKDKEQAILLHMELEEEIKDLIKTFLMKQEIRDNNK